MTDPYQPPESIEVPGTPRCDSTPEPLDTIARRVFWEWEKLRLIYVAWLVFLTLGVTFLHPSLFKQGEYWFAVVAGAVGANAAFFAGPIVETYLTWLGVKASWLRWALFTAGMLFASFLAVVTILAIANMVGSL